MHNHNQRPTRDGGEGGGSRGPSEMYPMPGAGYRPAYYRPPGSVVDGSVAVAPAFYCTEGGAPYYMPGMQQPGVVPYAEMPLQQPLSNYGLANGMMQPTFSDIAGGGGGGGGGQPRGSPGRHGGGGGGRRSGGRSVAPRGAPMDSLQPNSNLPGLINYGPGPPITTSAVVRGDAGCNLFCFHLPNEMTNWDLYLLFRCFGDILSVHIMVNKETGLSRGFGFISFEDKASAADAIRHLNGFRLGLKRLKVQYKRGYNELTDKEDDMNIGARHMGVGEEEKADAYGPDGDYGAHAATDDPHHPQHQPQHQPQPHGQQYDYFRGGFNLQHDQQDVQSSPSIAPGVDESPVTITPLLAEPPEGTPTPALGPPERASSPSTPASPSLSMSLLSLDTARRGPSDTSPAPLTSDLSPGCSPIGPEHRLKED